MKAKILSALIATTALQASANDPFATIRNNEYLKNKDQVVKDVSYDCKEHVSLAASAAPRNIIEKEGIEKFKQRTNYVCSYSVGAAIGSKLYNESEKKTQKTEHYNQPEKDQMEKLYASMNACNENTKSGIVKNESDYIYCMTINGVRDGFIYESSKKK